MSKGSSVCVPALSGSVATPMAATGSEVGLPQGLSDSRRNITNKGRKMTTKKIASALAVALVALALPAAASAATKTYAGGMDGGGKLGIDVKVKHGKVKKITEIRGTDIPTVCDESGPVPSHLTFPTLIKVDKKGRFEAGFEQPTYGNVSTIKGRFKAKMVEGKLSVDYHYPAEDGYPEEDCHTSKLGYQAIAGFPDPTS